MVLIVCVTLAVSFCFVVACDQFRSVFSHPVWDTTVSEKLERNSWRFSDKSAAAAAASAATATKTAKNWCKPCGFLEFGTCTCIVHTRRFHTKLSAKTSGRRYSHKAFSHQGFQRRRVP